MKKYSIYVMRNKITGKRYVGYTSLRIKIRLDHHREQANRHGSCKLLYSSIRKHGIHNFTIKKLQNCAGLAAAGKAERYWAAKLETFGPKGYNLTSGGEGARDIVFTPERRAMMSKITKRQFRSKKAKIRMSQIMKRNWTSPRYRAKQARVRKTKAYKRKMSTAQLNRADMPAIKAKQSRAMKKVWRRRDPVVGARIINNLQKYAFRRNKEWSANFSKGKRL
jgi:group I intron endonuclease